MSKTVEAIINPCKTKYNIKLSAGAKGLCRTVAWAYLAEDIGNLGFLKKDELIISTGYFTLDGVDLFDFVKELIGKNFAALIINTGKYINENDISPALVSLCNEKAFPLFTMPWESHISDLMQDICGALISGLQSEKTAEEAFASLLKGEPCGNIEILEKSGFLKNEAYRVCVYEPAQSPNPVTANIKYFCLNLDGFNVCVYCPQNNKTSILSLFGNLKAAGISSPKAGLYGLSELFKEAKAALRVSAAFGKKPVFYENLGLLKLILKIDDGDFLKNYMREKIAPLTDYDLSHDSNLTETLFYYILSGGSPAETAKITYTHRNTVSYRINKIKELLGGPLSDFEAMAEILAAIYIFYLTEKTED